MSPTQVPSIPASAEARSIGLKPSAKAPSSVGATVSKSGNKRRGAGSARSLLHRAIAAPPGVDVSWHLRKRTTFPVDVSSGDVLSLDSIDLDRCTVTRVQAWAVPQNINGSTLTATSIMTCFVPISATSNQEVEVVPLGSKTTLLIPGSDWVQVLNCDVSRELLPGFELVPGAVPGKLRLIQFDVRDATFARPTIATSYQALVSVDTLEVHGISQADAIYRNAADTTPEAGFVNVAVLGLGNRG